LSNGAVFTRGKVPLTLPLAVMLLSAALLVSYWLDGYQLGLVHGLVAAAIVGVAASRVRAPKDEKTTADLLGTAKKEHQVWGWVDDVEVQGGEVDHLVVTREGGLVAIDSRWSSDELTPELLAADAQRALLAARSAGQLLHTRDTSPAVRPLLVYWGSIQDDVKKLTVRNLEGVEFLAGRELRAWLRKQNGRPVERGEARRILKAARTLKRRADQGTTAPSGARWTDAADVPVAVDAS
jgi:hypothetical protein